MKVTIGKRFLIFCVMMWKFADVKGSVERRIVFVLQRQPKLLLETWSLHYVFADRKIGSLHGRWCRVQSCASDVVKAVIPQTGHR